jgi:hypothetical protein
MGEIDILSLVGTWVAAVVAIIVLVGIAGPILVYRASRTERHKAIAAIEDDAHEYIGRGVWFGPKIRLFKRLHVPKLDREITFKDGDFTLPSDKLSIPESRTSWIKLSALLKGYNFKLTVGDYLVVKDGKALLPIHRRWILGIGIAGRFGHRMDLVRRRRRRRDPDPDYYNVGPDLPGDAEIGIRSSTRDRDHRCAEVTHNRDPRGTVRTREVERQRRNSPVQAMHRRVDRDVPEEDYYRTEGPIFLRERGREREMPVEEFGLENGFNS